MMDMGSIAALVGSLKTAGEITKAAVDMRDGQMLQAKVIELQTVILTAQSNALTAQQDQFALLDRVRSLETEIAGLKAWDAEKQNYVLSEVAPGAFAYALKPDSKVSEPPHWLCVNCYNHSQKSLLQDAGRIIDASKNRYQCPECKAGVLVPYSVSPSELLRTEKQRGKALAGVKCPYCGDDVTAYF